MRGIILFLVLLVFLSACGGGGSGSNTQAYSETAVVSELVTLHKVVYNSFTKQYRYYLRLNPAGIYNDRSSPFISGEFTRWKPVQIAKDSSGFYAYSSLRSWNRDVKFTYGGNYVANSWVDTTKSKYYDAKSDAMIVGLKNGQLQLSGEPNAGPGIIKDAKANLVSFTVNPSTVDIYVNLNLVDDCIEAPFFMGSHNNWVRAGIGALDATGWAKVTLPMSHPFDLYFTFGGGATSWARMDLGSIFQVTQPSGDTLHFYQP